MQAASQASIVPTLFSLPRELPRDRPLTGCEKWSPLHPSCWMFTVVPVTSSSG